MHIDNTLRLDFKDVLIRPKRSTLISRSEVDITRDFKFLHAPVAYHGIPVIAANMTRREPLKWRRRSTPSCCRPRSTSTTARMSS